MASPPTPTTVVSVSKLFDTQFLTTSADTYYTAPSTPATVCLARGRLHFCNTTTGAVSVYAYAVASGSTPADHNSFVNGKSVAANDTYESDIPMLGPNDFVAAKAASGSAVTVSATDGMVMS